MTDPIASAMDRHLVRSLEMLGLPVVLPEPEVASRALSRIRCKSLAGLLVRYLRDSEPLLTAQQDGASVSVTDPDGNVMRFTIEAEDSRNGIEWGGK